MCCLYINYNKPKPVTLKHITIGCRDTAKPTKWLICVCVCGGENKEREIRCRSLYVTYSTAGFWFYACLTKTFATCTHTRTRSHIGLHSHSCFYHEPVYSIYSQLSCICRHNSSDNDALSRNSVMYVCVYERSESGDIGQFNLPRCMENLPGLIKFSYKLHNKQSSHVWDQLTPGNTWRTDINTEKN